MDACPKCGPNDWLHGVCHHCGYREFDDDLDDDDRPLCFRCDGEGEVTCHCGGDLCLCGREDIECPACHGEGRVSQEKFDRQIARHREMMTRDLG